ncbi:MAG TPA: metal ABC transporter permease [Stellaceae bacterium]|nr:metal ABC transporter permease [Stellaceae bacterium]
MTAFLQIDFPALLTGTLAALVCGLIGNFLVLTRQSMLGDAIGHVVLPGIVIAYVITGTTATWVMLFGAAAAALAAAFMVEFLQRAAGVEPGAALGAVFTALFALGVVLLEQTGIAQTTFDVHHILYGNVEAAIWPAATGPGSLLDPEALSQLPPQIGRLFFGLVVVAVVIFALFKELRVVSFDPTFAATIGLSPRLLGALVTGLAALAAVVSLASVGVILVVAMMVCPASTARMLTDDLATQIKISAAVAIASGILGYLIAAFLPAALGFGLSLGAAGTIAVVAGAFQLAAMLAGPKRHPRQAA